MKHFVLRRTTYYVLEEEVEMKKQEDLERSREAAEIVSIAEEERKKQEAHALPEEEKRKILKKQAKEKAFRKQKAMEDFEKHGIPLPEEFANLVDVPKAMARRTPPHRRIKKARNEESVLLPAPIVTAHLPFYVLRSGE